MLLNLLNLLANRMSQLHIRPKIFMTKSLLFLNFEFFLVSAIYAITLKQIFSSYLPIPHIFNSINIKYIAGATSINIQFSRKIIAFF
jgi:hypothetical protein